jgi:hypothetical protein
MIGMEKGGMGLQVKVNIAIRLDKTKEKSKLIQPQATP